MNLPKIKNNGYINVTKYFFVALAILGIVWNAATLHTRVAYLHESMNELKKQFTSFQEHLWGIK